MKKSLCVLAALIGMSNVGACLAERDTSFGVGLGFLYSGLGVNYAIRDENNFGYVSLGCSSFKAIHLCGPGIGWLKTDLFTTENNHHGVGVYFGSVGVDDNDTSHLRDDDLRYGVMLNYVYFLNGVDDDGLTLGLGLGPNPNTSDPTIFINLGYQF